MNGSDMEKMDYNVYTVDIGQTSSIDIPKHFLGIDGCLDFFGLLGYSYEINILNNYHDVDYMNECKVKQELIIQLPMASINVLNNGLSVVTRFIDNANNIKINIENENNTISGSMNIEEAKTFKEVCTSMFYCCFFFLL